MIRSAHGSGGATASAPAKTTRSNTAYVPVRATIRSVPSGRANRVREQGRYILRWYGSLYRYSRIKVAEEQRHLDGWARMQPPCQKHAGHGQWVMVSKTCGWPDTLRDAAASLQSRNRELMAHDRLIAASWPKPPARSGRRAHGSAPHRRRCAFDIDGPDIEGVQSRRCE